MVIQSILVDLGYKSCNFIFLVFFFVYFQGQRNPGKIVIKTVEVVWSLKPIKNFSLEEVCGIQFINPTVLKLKKYFFGKGLDS